MRDDGLRGPCGVPGVLTTVTRPRFLCRVLHGSCRSCCLQLQQHLLDTLSGDPGERTFVRVLWLDVAAARQSWQLRHRHPRCYQRDLMRLHPALPTRVPAATIDQPQAERLTAAALLPGTHGHTDRSWREQRPWDTRPGAGGRGHRCPAAGDSHTVCASGPAGHDPAAEPRLGQPAPGVDSRRFVLPGRAGAAAAAGKAGAGFCRRSSRAQTPVRRSLVAPEESPGTGASAGLV